jgi:hypothetical protein
MVISTHLPPPEVETESRTRLPLSPADSALEWLRGLRTQRPLFYFNRPNRDGKQRFKEEEQDPFEISRFGVAVSK